MPCATAYRFYHSSFEEYLLTGETDKEHPYRVYPEEANTDIARYLLEAADDGWEACTDPYCLAHLPWHLYAAELRDQLYELARAEPYAQAQLAWASIGDITDPDLPLRAPRFAIQAARDNGDLLGMAEFVLLHARRIERVARTETPLDALRTDNASLPRAIALADLYDLQRRLVWLLLLAWELKNVERTAEAREVLLKTVVVWAKLDIEWQLIAAIPLVQLILESAEFSATFWRPVTCAHSRRATVR